MHYWSLSGRWVNSRKHNLRKKWINSGSFYPRRAGLYNFPSKVSAVKMVCNWPMAYICMYRCQSWTVQKLIDFSLKVCIYKCLCDRGVTLWDFLLSINMQTVWPCTGPSKLVFTIYINLFVCYWRTNVPGVIMQYSLCIHTY